MWTEGVFVKTHLRGTAGNVVDGKNVKTERRVAHMAFRKESLCCTRYDVLFLSGYAEFRQGGELRANRSRTYFDKHQRSAVVSHQVQFAFRSAAGCVVSRDKYIAQVAQIPIRESLAADAGSLLFCAACGIHFLIFIL